MSNISTWSFIRRSLSKASVLAVGCAILVACGAAAAPAEPTATSPASEATPLATSSSKSELAQSAASASVTLEIGTPTGATEFRYDKDTLEAPADSKITLKFKNNTQMKDEVGHNWVLVKPGQEESVLANANAAGDDNDWLKPDDPGVIAHTALIEGEVFDTITFDAPPPGTYTYLCTFPKHYAGGEKGVLTIK